MATVREKKTHAPSPPQRRERAKRLIGWQGFTVRAPRDWDLTGFSGNDQSGYFRVDDSEEQALEIKWGTEPAKTKTEPDPEARRETYFNQLGRAAKKKKLPLDTRETDVPRRVARAERSAAGFTWSGDRKAVGAVWYCRECRRVVIAQVLGDTSGRGGLMGVAEAVLGSLKCHSDDPDWRTWALYDLVTEVPAEYQLVSQQLMNVYLRLSFAHKTARLSVEQWALANVARRGAYLDEWLRRNAKGELSEARFTGTEGESQGHPALLLSGGPGLGMPMIQVVRQMGRFQYPATRFSGTAWECEPSNKLYLVEGLRPRHAPDRVAEVALRTLCHGATLIGDAGSAAL